MPSLKGVYADLVGQEHVVETLIKAVESTRTGEETHATVISRVSQIQTLKRNAVEDKGNLLLRPIRAAGKAVKKTGTTATKAVKKSGTAVKAKTKKPVKK